MKSPLRGIAALLITIVALPIAANGQVKSTLDSERDKVSYMIGMDVGNSLKPVADDIDFAAFERAVRNSLDGGKPLIDDADAKAAGQALTQRAAVREGQQIPGMAPGSQPPELTKDKAGLFMGSEVGRSLKTMQDEIDLPTVLQGMKARLSGATPLLSDAEMQPLRQAFGDRMRTKMQAQTARAGNDNATAGQQFLAANKLVKGVFTTPSGLQYMVLKQGAGRRPLPTDRVRVNYRGTLLDGTEFDSSDSHGGPSEFGLNQVIAGWTEGVSMMPIGAKYRLWVPGSLAYGPKGSSGIGPNSTLVFDVELIDIL